MILQAIFLLFFFSDLFSFLRLHIGIDYNCTDHTAWFKPTNNSHIRSWDLSLETTFSVSFCTVTVLKVYISSLEKCNNTEQRQNTKRLINTNHFAILLSNIFLISDEALQ